MTNAVAVVLRGVLDEYAVDFYAKFLIENDTYYNLHMIWKGERGVFESSRF